MDLLLWRHAEAKESGNEREDFDRPLTARGRGQAKTVAHWLESQHLPKLRIFSAPSRRAQETAAVLGRKVNVLDGLAPGHRCVEVLGAIGWPDHREPVLLVGHQPQLGQLAALLLAGSEADWSVKKGGLWWFSNRVRQEESQTILRAVVNP
jgi:phosphohistidine phosphatase